MSTLSGLDLAFLSLERESTPMHVGAVALFRTDSPVDPDAVARLLAERAAALPRLRQRVRPTLFPPGGAEWVSTPDFRAADHISAYRLPDDLDLLDAYASRWVATPLDLTRPPWELHIVTGLVDGGFAVLLKLHHALTDGAGAVEIAAGLLDGLCEHQMPESAPAPLPGLVDRVRQGVEVAAAVAKAIRPPWAAPLLARTSPDREFARVRLDLADIRHIRKAHGGTVNDVILTVLTGALRDWMDGAGRRAEDVRAMVPVSVRGRGAVGGGNQISAYLCDLPVATADPLDRLAAVRASMDANKKAGPTKGAGALPLVASWLPPIAHRVGTRMLAGTASMLFDTVVTTVPFPRMELRLGGAAMREVYPVVPLAPGHRVGFAVSTYLDGVHIGLNADPAAVADLGRLADAIVKATAVLHERA
ncbi:wax ester/triacylglycerol synthase domain-containing protein [Actinokineospora sp. HUAS TT18]|uniref:wax ester/triacylglycerol synthase domain-containing protein n=1 Tax=Actinokineospora sp. HUAS TT18 TaxID=3447451 RepID=UPI003F520623